MSVPCDIILHCMCDKEIDIVVNMVFNHYRAIGFPYYELTDDEILKKHRQFQNYDMSQLWVEKNEINQIMHGLSLTNLFFPNMWSVPCNKAKTPKQIFDDDILFKKAILKRIKMSDSPLRPFNIRKSLKIFSGAQSVSAFRPSVAKAMVEKLCDGKNISVLDPCAGWGGRMYGSVTSDRVKRYVGFDVAKETVVGLRKFKNKLIDLKIVENKDIDIINCPFEDSECLLENYEKFDVVLTSPIF